MFLDYSRTGSHRTGLMRWLRAFWSHRARLDIARSASGREAVGIVAAVSLLGAILSFSHAWVYTLVHLAFHPENGFLLTLHRCWEQMSAVMGWALIAAPIGFSVFLCVLACGTMLWPRRVRRIHNFRERFAVVAAASMPVLWFFVLLQLEGLAPLAGGTPLWEGWNPLTNFVRFIMLMGAIVLTGLWVVDAGRLCQTMSDQGESQPAAPPATA